MTIVCACNRVYGCENMWIVRRREMSREQDHHIFLVASDSGYRNPVIFVSIRLKLPRFFFCAKAWQNGMHGEIFRSRENVFGGAGS